MLRVAVIGAGIVGASVAFRLSRSGAKVWVLDRGQVASGTTATSFAWVNSNNKMPRKYFELNRAGMKEHFRLADELSGTPWLHRSGNLIWAEEGRDLEELKCRVERLRSWGYAAEWLTASRVQKELEPHATFPEPDAPVAFFPGEAWVEAPRLAKLLLERTVENGAVVRVGARVVGIEADAGRVSGVRVAGEELIPVDAAVNAAGPAADDVAALVGRELSLESKDGLLVRVAAERGLLGRLLHTARINLRPDGPGHVLLHHTSTDEMLAEEDGALLARELLGRAREIITGLANARIEGIRPGTRPVPADGLACAGGVADLPGYYEAVTHSGVTLGPLLGRLLAQEILTGEIDPLAAPFRPDRFS